MSWQHLLLGVVEAACWYLFFWYLLTTIRKPDRDPRLAALVLLVLFYLAFVTCPWLRHTDLWGNFGKH